MPRQLSEKEKRIRDIVNPLKTAKWQADYRWDRLERSLERMGIDYGGLELCPDYQRGHVWTRDQQVAFIEACLRGIVSTAGLYLQFNCASWSESGEDSDLPPGLQCIDGLQRYTAITEFCKGNVKPFGLSLEDLAETAYSPKKFHIKIAVHDFVKRSDLLKSYLSLNSGGTQHSASEIERVRGLLSEC